MDGLVFLVNLFGHSFLFFFGISLIFIISGLAKIWATRQFFVLIKTILIKTILGIFFIKIGGNYLWWLLTAELEEVPLNPLVWGIFDRIGFCVVSFLIIPFPTFYLAAVVADSINNHIFQFQKSKEEKKKKYEEDKRKREFNEIKRLNSETNYIINEAIINARKSGNSYWLCAVRNLKDDVQRFQGEFDNGEIIYIDAKSKIFSLKQEAELLKTPIDEETKDISEKKRNNKTHYDILDLKPNARQEEIQKAYIEKVKQYHPDSLAYWANIEKAPEWIKKEANERTKKIIEAYQVLRDKNKRRRYDESIGG